MIYTSESVTEGHPDKICDQVSDAILDELLRQDPFTRAGIETYVTSGVMLVGGEVSTRGYVNVQKIARQVLSEIGYTNPDFGIDASDAGVLVALHEQSVDIKRGVVRSAKNIGAGDQGLMFGYACLETPEFMPLPIMLAHKLAMRLAEVRKKGIVKGLRPDGKSQVAVEYESGKPKRIFSVVLAAQHDPNVSLVKLRAELEKEVIKKICGLLFDNKTKVFINATGRFVIGGPEADTGLTGRKIIVDTYGGRAHHGGGCFSGKDASKVDRSASYAARYITKNLVAAGIARECEVQLAYAIGEPVPVSLAVNTFGTGALPDDKIIKIIENHFPLTPYEIIEHLKLRRPIYQATATYGHFGRMGEGFTWEKLDMVKELKKYIK